MSIKANKGSRLLFYSLLLLLMGCFSAKLLTPSQSDVDRVKNKFLGYSLAQLNHGKALYENYCKGCHGLKDPASKTEEEWQQIVPAMSKLVNKKKSVLDAQSQQEIYQYVVTMSTSMKPK